MSNKAEHKVITKAGATNSQNQNRAYLESLGIGLNGAHAYLTTLDVGEMEFVKRHLFAILGEFAGAKKTAMVFVTRTIGKANKVVRGCAGGICSVADIEIDTNDGKVKRTVIEYYDHDKREGGIVTTKLVNGLTLHPIEWLAEQAIKNSLVQIKTFNRFEGKDGRPNETLHSGAIIGSLDDKYAIVLHNDSKALRIYNANFGPLRGKEITKKLQDQSAIVCTTFNEAEARTVRTQLFEGMERTGKRSKALARLGSKKAHAKVTAKVLNKAAATS